MDIKDYEKIEIHFEDVVITFPNSVIERFQVQNVEQFIEKKYNPEDEYNIYIVINRILAEKIWKEEKAKKFEGIATEWVGFILLNKDGTAKYNTLAEFINNDYIYKIVTYNGEEKKEYNPVWTYTQFVNGYQRIGITDDKIMIHIKEM